jgi:cytidylate kinase
VYLTAATGERAQRRAAERGQSERVAEVADQLARRDHLDSTRASSPLASADDVAADAVVVDSTGRSAEDVLEEVLSCL